MLSSPTALPMVTSPSVLIERARTIAAEMAPQASEIDGASKLPDALIEQWIESGLLAILVPRRFGGYELGLETAAEVIRIFAAVCPSAAWVLAFYIGHNWIHCQFPEQGQQEIFADGPSARSAGVLAPLCRLTAVEGGYRVNGRTAWNSGAPHANWIMGCGIVTNGTPPSPRVFIIPQSLATLIDTWAVEGMRATGSWDVVLDDVFVPEHRTLAAAGLLGGQTPGSAVHANPLYTRPLLLVLYCYCAPVFVGAARGVADEFVNLSRARVGTNDGKSAAAKPAIQMLAGRGMARTELVESMLAELIRASSAPDAAIRADAPARLALKARGAMIAEFCKETINELVLGAGANAFRKQSRLQMAFRDINMISSHAFFEHTASTEGFGRSLLGLEQNGPV